MSAIVALDLGGVIVDVDHERCARKLGLPWSACQAALFANGRHDDVTVGRIDAEAFIAEAATSLGRDSVVVREAWADIVAVMPEGRALIDELLAVGTRVHLWSNTDPIHLGRILERLPHGLLPDTVSFRLGKMKPDATFFHRAMTHGVPEIFLDDRPDIVQAARAQGVRASHCLGPRQARALLVQARFL